MAVRPIEIIGAGPAGLSAAIALARHGHRDVRVFEKRVYPCVKLCGEFLSPEGLAAICRVTGESLEVTARELRLVPLKSFAWVSRGGRRLAMELDPPAWAVRRDVLDPWLVSKARAAGAGVELGVKVERDAPATDARRVWASGKEQAEAKGGYFAVKGYCRAPISSPEGADVALYQLRGGYIGFARLSDGEFSYCALFDRRRVERGWRFATWSDLVEGPFSSNEALISWARAAGALLPSHVGAARFDFQEREPARNGTWFVGDAVQLIPPFVGDGMAMAVESGELAAQAAAEGWTDSRYASEWRTKFRPRIRAAKLVHPLLWLRPGHDAAISALAAAPGLCRWIYRRTRGYAASNL
jgi:flavin-dependent dehydrogenase